MIQLAIDIVLLPPKDIMKVVVRLNRELKTQETQGIVLDEENCLPHITLAMKAVSIDDLEKLKMIMDKRAERFPRLTLEISDIQQESIPNGKTISMLVVEKTDKLQKLHNTLMNDVSFFSTYEPSVEMFYAPPPVESISPSWVTGFKTHSAFEHYFPHITLGMGVVSGDDELPVSFIASRLALCHLGNYCTCRKLLYEVSLL